MAQIEMSFLILIIFIYARAFRRILQSIAPSLYVLDHIKEAIMYLLFGSCSKEFPDVRIRGDINVLLVGDPVLG